MANTNTARGSSGDEFDGEVNMELDAASQADNSTFEAGQTPILVLSRDSNLIEIVRKATPRGSKVAEASDVDSAAEQLPRVRPGVLIADTAVAADVPGIVAQFTQHFPDLVVVVAGKREDSAALMALTAAGQIHRFLLTPLSHGQTRLALDSAVKRHQELVAVGDRKATAGGDSSGPTKNYTTAYAGLAAGIVLVIGGIWFFVSRMTAVPDAPQNGTSVAQGTQTGGIPNKPDPVKAEIAMAKDAFDAKHYLEPAGESALDLYRSALALDPKSVEAKQGIRSVADKILERSETALMSEHLEEAVSSLEIARGIQPDHPRLAFLDGQIARERERLQLSQAKEVGGKVRKLLADAQQRMDAGRLVTPQGDSARDSLMDARRIDPTDPDIQQSFRELAGRVVDEAKKAAAAGQMDQAQSLVVSARQLGAPGTALSAVERTLAENRPSPQASAPASAAASAASPAAKKPSGADSELAIAKQRLSANQLIEPKGDSAKDHLAAARNSDPSRPEIADLSQSLATRLLDNARQAMANQQFDKAANLIAAARDVNSRATENAVAQADQDLQSARDEIAFKNNVISAGVLKRTKTVAPVYPESAHKQHIEGWVEVVFTVTAKGEATDVEVRNSSPENVFDDAAVKAVKAWRFQPVERDGRRVPQRAVVRLKFAETP